MVMLCSDSRWMQGHKPATIALTGQKRTSANPHGARRPLRVSERAWRSAGHRSLSMDVDHKVLGHEVKVTDRRNATAKQMLEPVVRQKFAKIRDNYNELRLGHGRRVCRGLRAYNEGVAYRFETSLPAEQVKIYGEEANFRFTLQFRGVLSAGRQLLLSQRTQISAATLVEYQSGIFSHPSRGRGCGKEAQRWPSRNRNLEEYPGLWLHGTVATDFPRSFTLSAERRTQPRSRFQSRRKAPIILP